jgi:hypothetical protein
VGTSLIRSASLRADECMRQADMALYRAKESGRRRHVAFDEELDAVQRERQIIRDDLHTAIERGQIHVAYQPQVREGVVHRERGEPDRRLPFLVQARHVAQHLLLAARLLEPRQHRGVERLQAFGAPISYIVTTPQGEDRTLSAGAERQAINAPMQGTAADLIKLAMIAVQRELDAAGKATKMVMQVHDELVFEVPEAELDWVKTEVPRLMAGVAALKVPLLAEVGVGANWDEAH